MEKITIKLLQSPYITGGYYRLPTEDGGPSIYAMSGDWVEASAEDAGGNRYTVYWEMDDPSDPDELEDLDISSPTAVVAEDPWRDVTEFVTITY